MLQAAIPVFFPIGKRIWESDEETVPGKMIKPTIPAMAIDESCPTALGHASVTTEARISNRCAFTIRTKRAGHAPHSLRNDCYGDDFEAVQPAGVGRACKRADPKGEGDQRQRRWHGKAQPRGDATEQTRAGNTDGDTHLAASWPGEKLAKSYEVGVALLIDPFSPLYVLLMKITEVSDGTAKGG